MLIDYNSMNSKPGAAGKPQSWRQWAGQVLACGTNVLTASFTFGGLRELEGQQVAAAMGACLLLGAGKVLFEKDWVANLFSARPVKFLTTSVGFATFFALAVFFNLVNIAVAGKTESVARAETVRADEAWLHDTESVSRALARLSDAAARAAADNALALKAAASQDERAPLRVERTRLTALNERVARIQSLPAARPENAERAGALLGEAINQVREAAAALPDRYRANVPEIARTSRPPVDGSPIGQLEQLWGQDRAHFLFDLGFAFLLETIPVLTFTLAFAGITFADRVNGAREAKDETMRAIQARTGSQSIAIRVLGTKRTGSVVIEGRGAIDCAQFLAELNGAGPALGGPVIGILDSQMRALDPQRDVVSQLQGQPAWLEIRREEYEWRK